ncbi:MAG TPA: hypothetical protein VEL07_12390 [Planctomycetota bacterium]|nr:hypothetical protein [Planctomycetota bacterium]
MRGFLAVIVWCLATSVSAAATPRIAGGPWVLLRQDGAAEVGVEFAGPGQPVGLELWREGLAAVDAPTMSGVQRPRHDPTTVVTWRLARGRWRAGGFAVRHGTIVLAVGRLPDLPTLTSPARVAIAGGANWPRADHVARLATALGGEPQVMVAMGGGLERAFGRGGWEAFIPIVVVGADRRGALAPLVGGAAGDWAHGLRWGVLGLPVAGTADSDAGALARDLSPWQVALEPAASWDLTLGARDDRQSAQALAALLAVTGRLGVPLILAAGVGGGVLSEPLAVDAAGWVQRGSAGVRYCLATPGGEGVASLPAEAALPIDGQALIGLDADAERLRLVVEPAAGTRDRHVVHWRLDADGSAYETAIGADVARLADRVGGGDAEAASILSWQPGQALGALAPAADEVERWIEAGSSDAASARLVRRLVGGNQGLLNGTRYAVPDLPPWIARDCALRQIGRGEPLDQGAVAALAGVTSDHATLRAFVHAHQRAGEAGAALAPILARLRRQASGELALDGDPLLQHAFAAAAFDSPFLSPTVLRPLALALRERLDPLARGPALRFLERHGEVRGIDR